jgi:hypothetical protein
MQTTPVTRCQEHEKFSDGTSNREKLLMLKVLDVATARIIHLAVANTRTGAGVP